MELFLHINPARVLNGRKVRTHPCDLGGGHAFFRDVDGGSGEVRRRDVAFCGSCIAVHVQQVALVFDRTHGRVDLQPVVEALIVGARQVSQEVRCPRAAIAPILREPWIGMQCLAGWQRDQQAIVQQGGRYRRRRERELNPLHPHACSGAPMTRVCRASAAG